MSNCHILSNTILNGIDKYSWNQFIHTNHLHKVQHKINALLLLQGLNFGASQQFRNDTFVSSNDILKDYAVKY